MSARFREYLRRRPSLRDALLWCLPALCFGALLRGCLLHYMPYAYWGSDSRSYFDFAAKLFTEGQVSLVQKRRFLYPIYLAFVTLLPGAPLRWLPWLQHGVGLLSLIPLAYAVRKIFSGWRWWIIPITVLYAGHPMILWYEHELLAETFFFTLVLASFAGWTAWVYAPTRARAQHLWWLFLVPFALLILTKPASRFFWPGLLASLVAVHAWRRLSAAGWLSLCGALAITPLVGDPSLGAWLLYVSTFPLTPLETPLHHDYKEQVHDLVLHWRGQLETYHEHDDDIFNFLHNPARGGEGRPLWAALEKDAALRRRIYMDLAKEAIVAEPKAFLLLGLHRLGSSCNLSRFKETRFAPEKPAERFQDDYEEARRRQENGEPTPLPLALGFTKGGPLPPYAEFRSRLSPAPDSWAARAVVAWVSGYCAAADFVSLPPNERMQEARLTGLGWWLLASLALSWLWAPLRPALGVWTMIALSFVCAVFLATQVNPRYFAPVWAILLPMLFTPLEVGLTVLRRRFVPPLSSAPARP